MFIADSIHVLSRAVWGFLCKKQGRREGGAGWGGQFATCSQPTWTLQFEN